MLLATLPPVYPDSPRPTDTYRWLWDIKKELNKVRAKAGTFPYKEAPEPYGLQAADIIHDTFPEPELHTTNIPE